MRCNSHCAAIVFVLLKQSISVILRRFIAFRASCFYRSIFSQFQRAISPRCVIVRVPALRGRTSPQCVTGCLWLLESTLQRIVASTSAFLPRRISLLRFRSFDTLHRVMASNHRTFGISLEMHFITISSRRSRTFDVFVWCSASYNGIEPSITQSFCRYTVTFASSLIQFVRLMHIHRILPSYIRHFDIFTLQVAFLSLF